MSGPLTFLAPDLLDSIAQDLRGNGWAVAENALPQPLVDALLADLAELEAEALLTPAGIGRGQSHHLNRRVRGDLTHWLTRRSPAEIAFLDGMEGLRLSLNRRLFLGLFEFEAHFALYPPGGFYRRHCDSFRGSRTRIVSTAAYLNQDWRRDEGGLLKLWGEDGHSIAEILPRAGTLALFLSETIPHEVTPTRRARASIAGWFRVNAAALVADSFPIGSSG